MHYIISAIKDGKRHKQCLLAGKTPPEDTFAMHQLPVRNKLSEVRLFNAFLSDLPDDATGWLLFCPDTTVFQNLSADLLENLDTDSIYGIFGARLAKNLQEKKFCEYCGQIHELPQAGKRPQDLLSVKLRGTEVRAGTEVDVLGRQCLLLHSDLCRRTGLKFDSEYAEDFHVEDFCLRAAAGHGVKSRITSLPLAFQGQEPAPDAKKLARLGQDFARYHAKYAGGTPANIAPEASKDGNGQRDLSPWPGKGRVCTARFANLPVIIKASGLPGSAVFTPLLREETALEAPADAYHWAIDKSMVNLPPVIALRMMRPKSRILDVGCAFGDNGLFFKNELEATLWGMDYSASSLEYARLLNIYDELTQVDLENMFMPDFSRYYHFFNHIFIGDVLEHLREPGTTLSMCREWLAPGGSIIVSLPNIAQAYVQSSLLDGRFDYLSTGTQDYTHLRFFGGVNQAALYARQGLEIKQASASFYCPGWHGAWGLAPGLPVPVYEYLLGNLHCLVLQYICQLEKSDLDFEELEAHNLKQIEQSVHNNPAGLALTSIKYRKLLKYLEEKQGIKINPLKL
ncbi:MAG: class I SAM-dependent methyltransferase [Deltaproteobacteria bacterium]|jgi:2-polyprenyl-3-methyl-5-hydroxy-6-metoxy-1,4-benzoquinol methylase|nr:class I SAM-dependent methyltransferase [Deltaproteobacteria bacterium]